MNKDTQMQVFTVISQSTFRTMMVDSTDYRDKHAYPDKYIGITINAYASDGIIDFNIITNAPVERNNEHSGHPFAHCKSVRTTEGRSWVIDTVVDNSLMRELIHYIAMSDEELEKHCGNTLCCFYRASLIRILETACLGE